MVFLPLSLSIDDLLVPIDGGAGQDLAFSSLFDDIKEARRADPEYLAQGEWQADLKQSDWDAVVELAIGGLREGGKDLMLSGWLTEGLTQKHGFPGLGFGLQLTEALLQRYWDDLFPDREYGLEERAARLSWLVNTLSTVVGNLPLLESQGYGLNRYEESRQVENLARQNAAAAAAAVGEGKLNAELFQRAVVQTASEVLLARHEEVADCLEACRSLRATIDVHFGHEAPSVRELEERLQAAFQLLERLLKERGVEVEPAGLPLSEITVEEPTAAATSTVVGERAASETPLRLVPHTRDEAFAMLSSVATFFKETEPHSPVPYLVDRAIRWGRMPLEDWLKDVIKDHGVIDHIAETLGTRKQD